ncbi:unnamed protein product [Meloidogyne enterolobii]|uniref:Uncharacterized protein n=1 Tax=Meloidogyne enterolobii TaxID=390850 RepID=A0ACB1B8C5_MELEN
MGGGQITLQQIIEVILSIFLPPLAVCLHGGDDCCLHFFLSIVLTMLGFLPGVLHALWYCFYKQY